MHTINNDHTRLAIEQEATERSPRRRYGMTAKLLFRTVDVLYGRRRSLPKFVVLELVARVPYQTWEHAAYLAITRHAGETRRARRIYERVCSARAQQDNEQWHLFILEDMLEHQGVRLSTFRYRVVPQLLAHVYYVVAGLMYLVRPAWSYRLNADFEDHAEHEYMAFVAEHPELESTRCSCTVADDYGCADSFADVLRQIALDERAHKEESLIELERLASTGGHRWRLCALVVGAVVALLVGIALVGGGGLG
ncbi:MAG: alternative oxidase [Acidimicrobiales bacterium]